MIHDEKNKIIRIGSTTVPYRIVKGKNRHRISISIKDEGILQITAGSGTIGNFELDFLKKNVAWIQEHFQMRKATSGLREEFLSKIDREILLLGKPTPVQYIIAPKTSFTYKTSEGLMLYAPEKIIHDHKKRLLFYGLRAMAEKKLPKELSEWAAKCELKVNTIRIKDLSSRWGSCSTMDNINLNWQLIFLDQKLIDYVIIHELMHMHEMNHSRKFWAWVQKYCPDYRQARNKIKENSWLIGILT